MPSEPPRRVRCPECGRTLRTARRGSWRFGVPLFHVFVLPALWLMAVVPLWIHTWGNQGILAAVVQYVFVPATLWAALMGLVQDRLRVSRWVVVVYALVAGVVVGLHLVYFGATKVDELLVNCCTGLFVLPLLSCLVFALYRMNNRLNARAIH